MRVCLTRQASWSSDSERVDILSMVEESSRRVPFVVLESRGGRQANPEIQCTWECSTSGSVAHHRVSFFSTRNDQLGIAVHRDIYMTGSHWYAIN